ncbi:MAG: peptidylprolyl isomerase [Archangiaceae bacterium]|nr:peptidylprolyl isomerase [Archangiaceae bacterium]
MWRALWLCCLSGCTVVMHGVAEFEDRRSASDVEPFTRLPDAALRQRAVLALGRIQDPRYAGAIVDRLHDPVPQVREEAAFAAGLLGLSWQPLDPGTRALLSDGLLGAELNDRVIEALGRVVTPQTQARLMKLLQQRDSRAALALGLSVKRGARLDDAVIPLAAELMTSNDPAAHYRAAYLLAMLKRPAAHDALLAGLADLDPEVRALCAKALSDVGVAGDAGPLTAALADPDARVGVEAVRALAKLKLPVPALDRAPLLLAAAQAGIALDTTEPALQCRMAIARDKAAQVFEASKACGPLALHEVGAVKNPEALEPYLAGTSAEQLGALDALGASKAVGAIPKIRPLLASPDWIVAAGAAVALSRLKDRESIPAIKKLAVTVLTHQDIAPSVAEALTELEAKEAVPELAAWLASSNATVRHSAAAALTRLTGVQTTAPEVSLPRATPVPPAGSGLLIATEKGEIEIELGSDEAPRTAGNLWSLAKKGFFDGLTFHRIVPDFVAQGGDPRGDGEGGPEHSTRCELGHRAYLRGTVGMALSGKDTGGSQFFITHTATPHLDGRYTAFGRVKRGMEVVDALLEGDRMVKVTALP